MMLEALAANIEAWLTEDRTRILTAMQTPVNVATKTGRNDLVTNVDAASQQFLVAKIHTAYPEAKIEAEEGTAAKVADLTGLVFFVDPIDGTMNFVKQRANFAVMIGVYQDGVPLYGAILDVMRNELVTGGPNLPPMLNGQPVSLPLDRLLKDGLLGASGPMTIHNYLNLGDIALASSGARISGSAGMEFKAIALGQLVGYVSYLQPWDIAAGMAIGAGFGLKCTRPDGSAIHLLKAGVVVAAMPQAHAEILHQMPAK